MKSSRLFLLWLLFLANQSLRAAPPFSGTIFIDPDIITAADASTFISAPYAGQGMRQMYDRRVNAFITLNAYLFNATFNDGLVAEIQVNPEFGNPTAAGVEATKYGTVIGRLPTVLRTQLQTVWIHKGLQPFGGGNNNLLIHTQQGDSYAADGILEETFVHEAAHTSLDAQHGSSPGWLAAQLADPEFISTYARDNPTREDIAESFLPWLAVRHRPNRISTTLANTITSAIPNRLAYFDSKNFNLYPIVLIPEIAVFTGANTTPANARTDNIGTHGFPNTQAGSLSVAQTFTIKNAGTANLTGLVLTKAGTSPDDFVLGTLGANTLAPNSTTTFTVAFSPTISGVRDAVVSIASNDADENPFRIKVSGTGLSALEGWRQFHFGSTANAGNAADLFDFDRDGLVNLLEFAFGLDPKTPGVASVPIISIDAQHRLVIEFVRRKAATNPGIDYAVETGANIPNFALLALGGASVVSIDAVWERVTFTDPVVSPNRFCRMRVIVSSP